MLQDVSDLTVLVSSTPVKLQSCKGNTLKKKKVKTEKEKTPTTWKQRLGDSCKAWDGYGMVVKMCHLLVKITTWQPPKKWQNNKNSINIWFFAAMHCHVKSKEKKKEKRQKKLKYLEYFGITSSYIIMFHIAE